MIPDLQHYSHAHLVRGRQGWPADTAVRSSFPLSAHHACVPPNPPPPSPSFRLGCVLDLTFASWTLFALLRQGGEAIIDFPLPSTMRELAARVCMCVRSYGPPSRKPLDARAAACAAWWSYSVAPSYWPTRRCRSALFSTCSSRCDVVCTHVPSLVRFLLTQWPAVSSRGVVVACRAAAAQGRRPPAWLVQVGRLIRSAASLSHFVHSVFSALLS